jgi:hypothetical protein
MINLSRGMVANETKAPKQRLDANKLGYERRYKQTIEGRSGGC